MIKRSFGFLAIVLIAITLLATPAYATRGSFDSSARYEINNTLFENHDNGNHKGIIKQLLGFNGKGDKENTWKDEWNKKDKNDDDDIVNASLVINAVTVNESTQAVTIKWHTNNATQGVVHYSTSPAEADLTGSVTVDNFATHHEVTLTKLTPDTHYYYVIVATDENGKTAKTSVHSFRTDERKADSVAPRIYFGTAVNVDTDSAQIIWFTNESSDSRVWVSTSSSVDTSVTPSAQSNNDTRFHNLTVSGLDDDTTYYYVIKSTDEAGNTSTLAGKTFTTAH